MDRDHGTGFRLDPLAELEVQRALALGRARERYPVVPRETLLGYCEAAWEVALRADPRRRDLQGSFDRALLIIAWTQRRSGGRVPMRDLVDQTIPRIALEPFISERVPPVVVKQEAPAQRGETPVVAAAPRRPLLRVPVISPMPVGAAVAAGIVGVAVLNETEVLPIAPLQPAGGENPGTSDGALSRAGGSQAGPGGSGEAPSGTGRLSAGLISEGLAEATDQALAATEAAEPSQAPLAGADDDLLAAREQRTADARGAGEDLASAAAQVTAAQPAAPLPPAPAAPAPAAPAPAAPAPAAPAPVAPAPGPVVRIEMPAPVMILEVAPPADSGDQAEPGERSEGPPADGEPDTRAEGGAPSEPEEDDEGGGRGDEDGDDSGPLEVLNDQPTPDPEDEESSADPADVLEGGAPAGPVAAPDTDTTAPAPPPAEPAEPQPVAAQPATPVPPEGVPAPPPAPSA